LFAVGGASAVFVFFVFQFLIFDVTKLDFLLALIYLIWFSMSIACSFLALIFLTWPFENLDLSQFVKII